MQRGSDGHIELLCSPGLLSGSANVPCVGLWVNASLSSHHVFASLETLDLSHRLPQDDLASFSSHGDILRFPDPETQNGFSTFTRKIPLAN